LSFGLYSKN